MVQYKDGDESVDLKSIKLNLDGTTRIADVEKVKVFTTGLEEYDNNRFHDYATLIGSCDPQEGDFECELEGQLLEGINFIWLAVDVADDAVEGNFIDMSCLEISTVDETVEEPESAPDCLYPYILQNQASQDTKFAPANNSPKPYLYPSHQFSIPLANQKSTPHSPERSSSAMERKVPFHNHHSTLGATKS